MQPPAPGEVARLIAAADELTPPTFAAYLFCACYSAMRPGELDALRWEDLDFTPGAETINGAPVERQGQEGHAAQVRATGKIAMVEPLRERLLDAAAREPVGVHHDPRPHYVPSTRNHHWTASAAVGLGNTSLYEATRHYFAWYLLNVLELPDHVVAAQLRHDDGGTLVRELYGHPDAAIARERIRAAFREVPAVVALPSRPRRWRRDRQPLPLHLQTARASGVTIKLPAARADWERT